PAVSQWKAGLPVRSGFGLGTCTQEVPFQCSVKVWLMAGPTSWVDAPAAQTSVAEAAAVPVSMLPKLNRGGVGLGCRVQGLPFPCSIRGLHWGAQVGAASGPALAGDTAATEDNPAPGGGFLTACCFQAVPFQCKITGPLEVLLT